MQNLLRTTCLTSAVVFGFCLSVNAMHSNGTPTNITPTIQQPQRAKSTCSAINAEQELFKIYHYLLEAITPNVESLDVSLVAPMSNDDFDLKAFLKDHTKNENIDGILDLMKTYGDKNGNGFVRFFKRSFIK